MLDLQPDMMEVENACASSMRSTALLACNEMVILTSHCKEGLSNSI